MRLPDDDQQLFNGYLLLDLFQKHGARDIGNICGFFAVRTTWLCPCCHRDKEEIARLDKNGDLLCAIVEHHDHYGDLAQNLIEKATRAKGELHHEGWTAMQSIHKSFQRFPPTLICGDCNVLEPAAKKHVDSPSNFTFSPIEIMQFVDATPNQPHKLKHDRCEIIYKAAKLAMGDLSDHLRGVLANTRNNDDANFISIGDAAARVLKAVKLKTDEGKE